MIPHIGIRGENKRLKGHRAVVNLILPSLVGALLTLTLVALIGGCGKKKEKTSESTSGGLTEMVSVRPEERRSLAVMYFQNRTGDPSLNWLSRGFAELLITDLSQSPYLQVLSGQRLFSILWQMDRESLRVPDAATATEVARRAGAEAMLMGSFAKIGETVGVEVQLLDVASNDLITGQRAEGRGLESIFAMVDQLSRAIRNSLTIPVAEGEMDWDIADMATSSVQAYKAYTKGLEAFHSFNSGKAMVHMTRAVEIDSSFPMAYAVMAIRSHGMGDIPRATAAVGRAMALLDLLPEPERLLVKAMEAHISSDYDEGIRLYQKLLELEPEDPNAYLGLGQLYFDLEKFAESERLYKRILQKDPQHVVARLMLGLTYLQQGLADLAQSEVKKALRLNPDNPYAYIILSRIYAYLGRTADCQLQLRKASELDPEDPWLHNLIGYFYLTQNKTDAAIEEFKRYVALAPDDPNSHDSLAEGYFHKGDYKRAEEQYLYALKLKSDFANPYYWLGLIYQQKGQTKEAIERFTEYLRLRPFGPLAENARERLDELGQQ